MRTLPLALTVLLAGAISGGCSVVVDGAIQDRDAAVVNDSPCATFPDGTGCNVEGIAEALVCNAGRCELSVCGDGVVDERTEDCDDGNDVDDDGCDFECDFSCEEDTDCNDGGDCNGVETCSDTRTCVPGTPPTDGVGCETGGTCQSGTCVPAGCGNGVLDSGEECDPGSTTDGSCRSDCMWTCETNEECALLDTTVCDGIETCDVATHLCVAGTPLVCPDVDLSACTIESCDPSLGCVVDTTTNDTDGDGYYATACGGDDCDDTRTNVHEGLGDACGDSLDNDCNGVVDDGTPEWYVDCDGDGHAVSTTGAMSSCTVPTSRPATCASGTAGQWTTSRPSSRSFDCYDGSASARPGQTSWLTTSYPGERGVASYDYDCDGTTEYQYTAPPAGTIAFCSSSSGSCIGSSYLTSAPACGATRTLSYCATISGSCTRTTRSYTVGCH